MIHFLLKFKIFFLLVLAFSSTLSATSTCFSQPLLEVKTGYFFFSDSRMRKIYDKGGIDVQLCASYPFWNLNRGWTLNAYGAVEYLQRSGRSINDHQKTSLWAVPFRAGLKPAYAINANTQYYCGIGPRYFFLNQHNNSNYVDKNISKSTLGFFVNTGFNHRLYDRLVIDIFGEYSYAKIHFHSESFNVYTRDIQVGGFTFGGGLGYEF